MISPFSDFSCLNKERILAGHVHAVFPYEPSRRFEHRRSAEVA